MHRAGHRLALLAGANHVQFAKLASHGLGNQTLTDKGAVAGEEYERNHGVVAELSGEWP